MSWQVGKTYGRKMGRQDPWKGWITTGPTHSFFTVEAISDSGVALVKDVKTDCYGLRMPAHYEMYEESNGQL